MKIWKKVIWTLKAIFIVYIHPANWKLNSKSKTKLFYSWINIIWDYSGIPTPYGFLVYIMKPIIQKRIALLRRWFYELKHPVIYVSYWSRDCDMCESTSFAKYKNRKEFNKSIEIWDQDQIEWGEGPANYTEISEREFVEYEGQTFKRDRVMEAFENGNGRSIFV